MKKRFVWRPSTPSRGIEALTVGLPAGTPLLPTRAQFNQAMTLKVWDLPRQAIEEAGDQARWEVGGAVKDALPGAYVEPDELNSLDDAIMMSDQMTALIGEINWYEEPAARPLLTKDDLEAFKDQSLATILESL